MTTALTAYIGRDNEERLELLNGGSLVTAEVVTRAVFKFGSFVLDSDVDTDLIYFTDSPDNQTIGLKLGLVQNLTAGNPVSGLLTVYDAVNTNGLAWEEFTVYLENWPVTAS